MGGISGSKAKSTSTSEAYGYQGSESLQRSQSSGVAGSQTTQDIAFADLFGSLFGGASSAAANVAQQVPGLQGQAEQLFSGGLGFLDQLGGGAGQDYLQQRLAPDSGLLDQQIGALGEDVGRFLQEQVNPQITSQHVAGGTLGGGRQGVAQGLAAGEAAREFQRGATGLRVADQAQRDQIAQQSAQLQQQGGAQGLAALPGLFGLAEAGAMAELSPFAALAQIMGGPTTLTQGSSFSQDQAIAEAISKAFGEDFSQGKSKSRSGSFGLNIGGE